MKKYVVDICSVDWVVEDEDVMDDVSDSGDSQEIEEKIAEIKRGLPFFFKNVELEAEDEDDLEQKLSDWLSDMTGWLHGGFRYRIHRDGRPHAPERRKAAKKTKRTKATKATKKERGHGPILPNSRQDP